MPLPITTSFCLVGPAVCVISLPESPTATIGDQECARRFQDGVTTTAPSWPKAAQNCPCAFAHNGVSSRRAAVIVDWPVSSNRHANVKSLRNARNSGKVGPNDESLGQQCRLFNQIAHIVGDAILNRPPPFRASTNAN